MINIIMLEFLIDTITLITLVSYYPVIIYNICVKPWIS